MFTCAPGDLAFDWNANFTANNEINDNGSGMTLAFKYRDCGGFNVQSQTVINYEFDMLKCVSHLNIGALL